ncbi:MAG: type II secretion system F family protein [Steroidobacteraceae bacterium]
MGILSQIWIVIANVLESRLVIILLIATAAFMFARGVLAMISWAVDPARRRLGAVSAVAAETTRDWGAMVTAAIQPFARFVMPTSNKELGTMQDRLLKAGFNAPEAPAIFYGLKTVLAVAFFAGFMFASNWLPKLDSSRLLFFAATAAFVGMTLPNFYLNRMVERRQRALRHAFPDALDLLVVCVESGLGLGAGLQRVAMELHVSYPELAAELDRVNAEMQAGMERELALRNLATRTGLTDIRSLVGLLIQTMRFGTSVADALRIFSEEFRDKRMQLAEEQAAKLGTKMIFPMVLCFFPSFFLVAVGPAVVRVIRVFGTGH